MEDSSEFQQLNVVGIDTRWGYKTFHLHRGDVTRPQQPADVLVISVYAGDYSPLPGTVVQALADQLGLNIAELASTADLDLRAGLGCWISRPTGISAYSRILCVELGSDEKDLRTSIENLFAALSVAEAKNLPMRSVAMPLLGTGSLRLDPEVVMQELLDRSLEYMRRSQELREIRFVEIDAARARLLDEAMNSVLGRTRIVLPKGELIQNLSAELTAELDQAIAENENGRGRVFRDLRRVLDADAPKSFEIGVAVRRVAERIAADLSGEAESNSLFRSIEALPQHGVAKWIISYFHVLRVFGNEAAHEHEGRSRRPPHVDEADLAICLFCVQRVVQFWLEQEEGTSDGSAPHGA